MRVMLIPLFILVILVTMLVVVACAPADAPIITDLQITSNVTEIVQQENWSVYKFRDMETNTVCYVQIAKFGSSIFCK